MAGSWSCPHEANDLCAKVNNLPCDPGMKGCTLAGRFVFFNEEKNERLRQKHARAPSGLAPHAETKQEDKP
jgi:orotidine-5'-phosphate decarboxylase